MKTLAPIAALLTGVAFLIAGHGLQLTIVPLRAQAEGWGAVVAGALGSAYYVGFVAGCLGAPFVIIRAGHVRAFAAITSLTAATTIAHILFVGIVPWLAFRFVIGVCFAGLYMIIESWLNDRATNTNRGLLMSAYIIVNFAAITVGQLLATLHPPRDFSHFAIATLAISLAVIPVALTRSAQPPPIKLVRFRPAALYRSSPVGVVGVTMIGIANGSFWALGAVFAVGAGLPSNEAAIFMSCAVVGGALSQWPAGRLSDRVDRRLVLITLLSAAALAGLALAFLPLSGRAWFVLAFLFGVATLPTYSIAAAHAYDHAEPGTFVETSAGILLANGAGAIVGPLLASFMMEKTGTSTLFLFTALVQALLALFIYSRLRARAAPATADKTGFDRAATAPVGAVIPPESFDIGDANAVLPIAGRGDDPDVPA
jgi:MFS family permease